MISIIIPTTSKTWNYTDNILNNINEIYSEKLASGDLEVIIETNDSVTLGINYNNAVARASGDKIILLHNDMIVKAGFIEQLDQDIVKNRITTYTRVEPPIFNDTYPGKVLLDCGTDLESFNSDKFNQYTIKSELRDGGSQLFFGCMREDYIGIDGYTFKMFCEDDDLHKRYKMAGFEHKVSSAHVYHFVSKTSRSTSDYQQIEQASNRNFVRKWGARQDGPKYNIAFKVANCNMTLLQTLEPWCDRIYIDDNMQEFIDHYIDAEQPNTKFDLYKRIFCIGYNDPDAENDIVVSIDATRFTEQDFNIIQQLPLIIQNSGEPGEFTLGNLHINIVSTIEYQNDLICL
jgi:hypothetical protein